MYYSFQISNNTEFHLNSTFNTFKRLGFRPLDQNDLLETSKPKLPRTISPGGCMNIWRPTKHPETWPQLQYDLVTCTLFWHPKTGWWQLKLFFYVHLSIWEMIHFDELIFFRWVGSTTPSASFTHSIAPPRSPWWTSLRPCCILGINEEREGLGHLSPLSGGPIEMHPLKITLR